MPDWVHLAEEDVVLITFACVYVFAGIGMYFLFFRNKISQREISSNILRFLTNRLEKRSKTTFALRWSIKNA